MLISRTLTFNNSATECPNEIKNSVLNSADQGLTYFIIKGIYIIDLANRATLKQQDQ